MQNYTEVAAATSLKASRQQLVDNDKTVLSNSSGTSFPTANLQVGMLCFRTDENKLYILTALTPTWQPLIDMSRTLAMLNSPVFTNTAAAPTVAGTTDNTTKIATTAFTQSVAALFLKKDGSVAATSPLVGTTFRATSGTGGTNTGFKLANGVDIGTVVVGPTGATGPTGPTGATGPMGPAGCNGISNGLSYSPFYPVQRCDGS